MTEDIYADATALLEKIRAEMKNELYADITDREAVAAKRKLIKDLGYVAGYIRDAVQVVDNLASKFSSETYHLHPIHVVIKRHINDIGKPLSIKLELGPLQDQILETYGEGSLAIAISSYNRYVNYNLRAAEAGRSVYGFEVWKHDPLTDYWECVHPVA